MRQSLALALPLILVGLFLIPVGSCGSNTTTTNTQTIPTVPPTTTVPPPTTTIPPPTTTVPPTTTPTIKVIFQDDFNGETTGANPSKWTVLEPTGTDISIDGTIYFGATGKSLKIQDNSATEGPTMITNIGSQTGRFWYEVSIRLAQTNQIVGAAYIGNSAVPAGVFNIENLGVSITFWSDGYIKYNDNDNLPWKNIQTYQVDTWYTVKVLVDVPNQKINVYIDGVLKLSDIRFRYLMTSLDQLFFGGRAELPASTIWIDNILVTEAS